MYFEYFQKNQENTLKYRIGVNENGDILMPGDDSKGEQWQYLDLVFYLDIPVMDFDERKQIMVPTGAYYQHEIKVTLEEKSDKTAFREAFFHKEDLQKTMSEIQYRLRELSAEKGWVWSKKNGGPTAMHSIRCEKIY